MAFKVFPYKQGSASAKALATTLEGKVLKINGSKYRPKRGDVVVNWGAGTPPAAALAPATVLNVKGVGVASCKLATFKKLKEAGVRTPGFTESKVEAEAWFNDNTTVVCRTKLRGHSGDGIVIADKKDDLVQAPLYTLYVKKKDEYRVHVMGDDAFFIQRKARKLDNENPNWKIRNLAGGFVFVEVAANEVPEDVLNQARESIKAIGLDFGGVDVMWNELEGKAYVLEINTACGLEERTALKYRDAIRNLLPNIGR